MTRLRRFGEKMKTENFDRAKTRELLIEHYNKYPLLKTEDIFKYVFQSAFGCEHLASDLGAALAYMEKEYAEVPEDFERFSLEEYLDFFVDMLERLRPDLFIERFVGEVPPRFVNETPWGLIRNVELLRLLEKRLEERNSWQGKRLESPKTNS